MSNEYCYTHSNLFIILLQILVDFLVTIMYNICSMMKFSYNITYSRRKTLQILVKNAFVEVRAPFKCDRALIEKFLMEKQDWVLSAIKKQKRNMEKAMSVDSFSEVVLFGQIVKFSSVFEKETLVGNAIAWIEGAFWEYVNAYAYNVKSLAFSNAKTLWGSCSPNNGIRLNRKLISLPKEVVLYVIIHELSHTLHHNHSSLFWNEVAKKCPNFKYLRKCLKENSWVLENGI